jgi:hypothetical protein
VVGSDDDNDDHEHLGPGLHTFEEAHPLKRAGHLASRLRADLCATLPQVVAAIEVREGLPTVATDDVAALRSLARRLAVAQRIAADTHARAAEEVAERLTTSGGGVAGHPTSVRQRAEAVELRRAALRKAEQALAAHEATAAAAAAPADGEAAVDALPDQGTRSTWPGGTADPDVEAADDLRPRRLRAIGAIVAAAGVGLVLTGLDVVALWAALIPTLLACLWALRHLQPPGDDDDADRRATSALLREMAAATDEAFGARRGSSAVDGSRTLLVVQRDQALEEVRVAERQWRHLAGADADVVDVEAVLRRFDPQHHEALTAATETAPVRAASSLVAQLQDRWRQTWIDLGGTPPDPAEAEAAVERLADVTTRPVVLVGPAILRAQDLVVVAPTAPVIVLDGPIDD